MIPKNNCICTLLVFNLVLKCVRYFFRMCIWCRTLYMSIVIPDTITDVGDDGSDEEYKCICKILTT